MSNIVENIWRENLQFMAQKDPEMIAEADVDEVYDMIIADQIDPQVFLSNLEVLLSGRVSLFSNFSGVGSATPSPSSYYCDMTRRASAFPLWFYAAYPDVMKWFHEWQIEHGQQVASHDEKLTFETMKLFGVEVADIENNVVFNELKQYKPKYLKNLVANYKEKTGRFPEAMVEEFSANDMYTGQEMLESLGTESTFTLIAENITKFYLELKRNYQSSFPDEITLYATAGVIDAQWDIQSGEIKVEAILEIARESQKSGDPFLAFTTELGITLLAIDSPNIDIEVIREHCEECEESIKKAIAKTEAEYSCESRFTYDTKLFMESENFNKIRKKIGIR